METKRKNLPVTLKREVLMEAGYRCAVPTCRTILAIDLHHIIRVSKKGKDELSNLIALCPTCHALHTRGEIPDDAIHNWKGLLISLNSAFDKVSIDNLLFLYALSKTYAIPALKLSSDGLLPFSSLIASGFVSVGGITSSLAHDASQKPVFFLVQLTEKGKLLVEAWFSGNRKEVENALSVRN